MKGYSVRTPVQEQIGRTSPETVNGLISSLTPAARRKGILLFGTIDTVAEGTKEALQIECLWRGIANDLGRHCQKLLEYTRAVKANRDRQEQKKTAERIVE